MTETAAHGRGPQTEVLRSLLHAEPLTGWPHPLVLGDLPLARAEDGRVRILADGLDERARRMLADAGTVEIVEARLGPPQAGVAADDLTQGVLRTVVAEDGDVSRVRVEVGALTDSGFEQWELVEVALRWDGRTWTVHGTPLHLAT